MVTAPHTSDRAAVKSSKKRATSPRRTTKKNAVTNVRGAAAPKAVAKPKASTTKPKAPPPKKTPPRQPSPSAESDSGNSSSESVSTPVAKRHPGVVRRFVTKNINGDYLDLSDKTDDDLPVARVTDNKDDVDILETQDFKLPDKARRLKLDAKSVHGDTSSEASEKSSESDEESKSSEKSEESDMGSKSGEKSSENDEESDDESKSSEKSEESDDESKSSEKSSENDEESKSSEKSEESDDGSDMGSKSSEKSSESDVESDEESKSGEKLSESDSGSATDGEGEDLISDISKKLEELEGLDDEDEQQELIAVIKALHARAVKEKLSGSEWDTVLVELVDAGIVKGSGVGDVTRGAIDPGTPEEDSAEVSGGASVEVSGDDVSDSPSLEVSANTFSANTFSDGGLEDSSDDEVVTDDASEEEAEVSVAEVVDVAPTAEDVMHLTMGELVNTLRGDPAYLSLGDRLGYVYRAVVVKYNHSENIPEIPVDISDEEKLALDTLVDRFGETLDEVDGGRAQYAFMNADAITQSLSILDAFYYDRGVDKEGPALYYINAMRARVAELSKGYQVEEPPRQQPIAPPVPVAPVEREGIMDGALRVARIIAPGAKKSKMTPIQRKQLDAVMAKAQEAFNIHSGQIIDSGGSTIRGGLIRNIKSRGNFMEFTKASLVKKYKRDIDEIYRMTAMHLLSEIANPRVTKVVYSKLTCLRNCFDK